MLQGIVDSIDFNQKKVCIAVHSKRYFFDFEDLSQAMPKPLLKGMLVDFEAAADKVLTLSVAPLSDYDAENTTFGVPKSIGLSKGGVPDGFMLIDKAAFPLSVIERSEVRAKQALAAYCKRFGANVILEFKLRRFIKNSIGFSYYMYKAEGIPAVIGFPSAQSKIYLDELENSLDHKAITEIIEKNKSAKIGIKIMKISGAILLLIFILGFIVSFTQ